MPASPSTLLPTPAIASVPRGLDLLAPEALAKISRLELVARQVMDGYIQGLHRSSQLGFATDFAQHRPYAPGDDIKRLDWRLYAKADRYYVKQYEVATSLQAHLVLDGSGSMAYQGRTDPLSKFRYAQFLAACLAYLILHQQDSVGLVTLDRTIRQAIPARSTPAHLLHILEMLDRTQPGGEAPLAALLHRIAEQLAHRGMVIIISDLFAPVGDLIEALHHFRHRRHEVILLHVMAQDELTFPFNRWTLFRNLEQAQHRVRGDPALLRRLYLQNVAAHLAALRRAAGSLYVSYRLLRTAQPFHEALTGYLARRMQKRGL